MSKESEPTYKAIPVHNGDGSISAVVIEGPKNNESASRGYGIQDRKRVCLRIIILVAIVSLAMRTVNADDDYVKRLEDELELVTEKLFEAETSISDMEDVLCQNWEECVIKDQACQGPGVIKVTRQPGFVQSVSCVSRGKAWRSNCEACPHGRTKTTKINLIIDWTKGMIPEERITFEGHKHGKHGPHHLELSSSSDADDDYVKRLEDELELVTDKLVEAETNISDMEDILCQNWKECVIKDQACRGPGVKVIRQQIAPGYVQQLETSAPQCVSRGKAWRSNCKACPHGSASNFCFSVLAIVL